MEDIMNKELECIDALPKLGLACVEYSAYALGLNIAPRKRSSKPCKIICFVALIMNLCIIYSLIQFIMVHYTISFEAYVEAVLLTFQISVGVVKMFYFRCYLDVCVKLLRATEMGGVLRSIGIFDLGLPHKFDLRDALGSILRKSWQEIDKQVMFFFRIVCMPVFYYIMRPYFQYIHYCYIVEDNCNMTLTYPAIVPYVRLGTHEYPSYILRSFLLQTGPLWCFFTVFGFNSLFVVLTGHEVGLLQVLRLLVQHSTSDAIVPKNLRVPYLRCCVRLYARINRHHAQIEYLFKYIILVQCIVSCMLICMLLYKISTVIDVGFVMLGMIMVYLITITLEISLYNVNAQKVESQSELLYFDWYNCGWYNECPDFKFMIKMMLLFSRRSLVLSVGGFTNMSHKFLVQVFRMSGNFFLLLRNMNNKME
ncbi:odorant receptor 67b-like [Scaptodrosophila lebanonensis]|uniref:Odorant receptor n=1 Tax=Drosophila lebanonensis TaxID=7225 RepID=A0A6J2UFH5_DROLE|nr:odorant receptor 67b-like [Scaptodrosophila lebanonensis]